MKKQRPSENSPLRRNLAQEIRSLPLERPYSPDRHEPQDILQVEVTGVWPRISEPVSLQIERFIGGGFAGQVYQARVLGTTGAIAGIHQGALVAIKVHIPPSRFSVFFRDTLYKLAFQGDFSAQVNPSAVMAGALWQKFLRRGAELEFGTEETIVDIHGIFFDSELGSWAEISEWVPGRTWLLEVDHQLFARRKEKPQLWDHFKDSVGSPEYLNKRAFMARLVRLFHRMGAFELARQYEWWSLKSQPNALKRLGSGEGPADGLTAIDFRAGLALVPFLPMSPVDFALIVRGIARGSWVQFDRGDLGLLEAFVKENSVAFEGLMPALDDLRLQEDRYRSSLPDIAHQGLGCLSRPELRHGVREGFIRAWLVKGVVDEHYAARLHKVLPSFLIFMFVGLIPLLGGFVRKLQGNAAWRAHVRRFFTSWSYAGHTLRAHQLARLIGWHRDGLLNDQETMSLANRPVVFWTERVLLGWLPQGLHRLARRPLLVWEAVRDWVLLAWNLATKEQSRVDWLMEQVEMAREEGIMKEEEERQLMASISDPFIQTYLKCVAIHICTLPITQVVSVLIALWYYFFQAASWQEGLAMAGGILAAFQATPVSPGSLSRALYVLYRIIRDRNIKDYWVALLLSMWHYVGYIAFPVQMVARFPGLAVFLGGNWATQAARVVPVFGEKGALLEHFVFDSVFNLPLSLKALVSRKRPGVVEPPAPESPVA